ncbi:MAG: hypothetical protein K2M55_00410 [Muribaculaceae bacterium]|nr:hypothetical protein [Muribaculaceae bacterium]
MGRYSNSGKYGVGVLAALVAQKDLDALGELLRVRLHDRITLQACRKFGNLSLDDIEEYYSQFIARYFERSLESEGWCLGALSETGNVEGFFYTSFRNFVNDQLAKEHHLPASGAKSGEEGDGTDSLPDFAPGNEAPYDPVDESDREIKERKELEIETILDVLEYIFELDDMTQYEVTTDLISRQFRGNSKPVKVPEGIAKQFNKHESEVAQDINKKMKKLKAFAQANLAKRLKQ